MTVPGVGRRPRCASSRRSTRSVAFRGAHAVESYLGLVPGEDSSAERKRRHEYHQGRPDGAALVFGAGRVGGAPRAAERSDAALGR